MLPDFQTTTTDFVPRFSRSKKTPHKIVGATYYGRTLKLEQGVASTGRFMMIPKGTAGTLVEMCMPESNGRMSDVFKVKWDGLETPMWMEIHHFE